MPLFVAPIVEGHGEEEAVPALLHRIAHIAPVYGQLRVNKPIRVKAGSFLQDDSYFGRYITLAAAKAAQSNGIVVIMLDCDDDCPARLGPVIVRRSRAVRDDVDFFISLASREFETWFVTSATSLRGLYGLPLDLSAPDRPEDIRDAKGWLRERMGAPYDPITHQLAFTRKFDLAAARQIPSFDRLYRYLRTRLGAPPPTA